MLRLGIPAFVVKARGAAIEDLELVDFSQRTMHPILTGTIAYLLMGAVANVLCMFWPAAMKDRGCAKLLPDRPPSPIHAPAQ